MFMGRTTIQRNLDRLNKGANGNLMKFCKDKCKILHQGRKYPLQYNRLSTDWTGCSFAGKDLGVLVGSKLNRSQQCVLAAEKVVLTEALLVNQGK